MRFKKTLVLCSASAVVMLAAGAPAAFAQTQPTDAPAQDADTFPQTPTTPAGQAPGPQPQEADEGEEGVVEEVVVTGIRQSLQAAADIKRSSDQVVDSIVAEDIGKFPDPTTASALQRVPGVQVSVGDNNEIQGVIIRGLGDILTTVDGREIFSSGGATVGRSFAFQDLPAESLARVDVIKSSSANLIEGGVAGVVDLRLNKPFNFREPTVVLSARANYSDRIRDLDPQVGVLLTDRFDTPYGEIGLLVNATFYETDFDRPFVYAADWRATQTAPFGIEGGVAPNAVGGLNIAGEYERPSVNFAVQWRATPELQIYVDGLYAGYRSEFSRFFRETQLFNATGIENLRFGSDCFDARVRTDNGFSPRRNREGEFIDPFTTENVCPLQSGTFIRPTAFTSTQALIEEADNTLLAGGFRWERDRLELRGDLSFQKTDFMSENFIVDIGGVRIPSIRVNTNDDNGPRSVQPGLPLQDPANFPLIALIQDFRKAEGDQTAVQFDGEYELDSYGLTEVQFGARYQDRSAVYDRLDRFRFRPDAVGGVPISNVPGLPANFLVLTPENSRLFGGPVLTPNPDILRSDEGRDIVRGVFGLPAGDFPFQPERRFEADETNLAAYVQVGYEVPLGATVTADGLVGVRAVQTERTIAGAGVIDGVVTPFTADTEDTNLLPNVSARFRFANLENLQARLTYYKTIRRPEFDQLNPGISYSIPTNPNVIPGGSAGNPDLEPQEADSYDATLEYYFENNGYVAAGVFYRDISGRVLGEAAFEEIDGFTYSISRPRNLGEAQLQGVELSAQTFFDFLPGALSGLGAFGNYTFVDSEVGGGDALAGQPIEGVSEHNYNIGVLYERNALSGRLVYTYRSSYYHENVTGNGTLRPVDEPFLLSFVRGAGRLDFSVGYDITDQLRIDVGGTNITGTEYKSYWGRESITRDVREDDTIYTVGLRARF